MLVVYKKQHTCYAFLCLMVVSEFVCWARQGVLSFGCSLYVQAMVGVFDAIFKKILID